MYINMIMHHSQKRSLQVYLHNGFCFYLVYRFHTIWEMHLNTEVRRKLHFGAGFHPCTNAILNIIGTIEKAIIYTCVHLQLPIVNIVFSTPYLHFQYFNA